MGGAGPTSATEGAAEPRERRAVAAQAMRRAVAAQAMRRATARGDHYRALGLAEVVLWYDRLLAGAPPPGPPAPRAPRPPLLELWRD